MTSLQTARLQLSSVGLDDLAFFVRLWRNPEVMTHLGGIRDKDRIAQLVRDAERQWRVEGLGRWVIRHEGERVGTVKLAPTTILGRSEIELGYALAPEYTGCGYATEASRRVLDFGFSIKQVGSVVAFAIDGNHRSLAVIRRLGFKYERRFQRPVGTHVLFRTTAA